MLDGPLTCDGHPDPDESVSVPCNLAVVRVEYWWGTDASRGELSGAFCLTHFQMLLSTQLDSRYGGTPSAKLIDAEWVGESRCDEITKEFLTHQPGLRRMLDCTSQHP